MRKKVLWILFAVLSILIGLYPIIYFCINRKFGLLGTKSNVILSNLIWNIGFYVHIILGGLALLIGWIQFNTAFRERNILLHKKIGKVYMISVLLSGVAGIGIGFFATGGLPAALGFICLGLVWLYSTIMAYAYIREKHIQKHQEMMIYSYAACFGAVTLRIWLPILVYIFQDFFKAYTIVAWLAWVPNIIVAYFIIRKMKSKIA